MSVNCDDSVIFWIYGQFGAIWKLDSRCIVDKFYIFINSNLLSCKNWKQNQRWKHSSHITALSKGTIIAKKCWFSAKKADINKNEGS